MKPQWQSLLGQWCLWLGADCGGSSRVAGVCPAGA